MIKNYKLFWQDLLKNQLEINRIKKVSQKLLVNKKENANRFKFLQSMIPFNKELETLNFIYKNQVTWEPIEKRTFQKQFKLLEKKLDLQIKNPYFLNLFDKNTCVVGVDINSDDFNHFSFTSANTQKVFETDSVSVNFLRLNKIMPASIAKIHNQFLLEYKENQSNKMVNDMVGVWAFTIQQKLFYAKVVIKILMDNQKVSMNCLFKAVCYKKYIVSTQHGEIEGFGEYFNGITGISYDTPHTGTVLSIFLFMPSLIPYFLNFFYDDPKYSIPDFNLIWLNYTLIFQYKKQRKMIEEFSKLLQKSRDSKEMYCQAIYDFLSKIELNQVKRVFQVRVTHGEFHFKKNKIQTSIKEFCISEMYEVTSQLNQSIFNQFRSFLKKLDFSSGISRSLKDLRLLEDSKRHTWNGNAIIRHSLSKFEMDIELEQTKTGKVEQSEESITDLIDITFEKTVSLRKSRKNKVLRQTIIASNRISTFFKENDCLRKTFSSKEFLQINAHQSSLYELEKSRILKKLKYEKLMNLFEKSADGGELKVFWWKFYSAYYEKYKKMRDFVPSLNIG